MVLIEFSLVDSLVATLLNYSIKLQNWILEMNYLLILILVRIKILEFVYWNTDWNLIEFIRYETLIHHVHIQVTFIIHDRKHLFTDIGCSILSKCITQLTTHSRGKLKIKKL